MDLNFTEEQLMIQKLAKDFAEKRLLPTVSERDDNQEFNRPLMDEMMKIGMQAIPFPQEYGGSGAGYLAYILAVEEISKYDDGAGITFCASASLCGYPIFAFGTEAQKQKYLRPLCEGSTIGAFGLTEANAGSDASAQTTVAVLDNDEYVINGAKLFNTNGGEAETYVVMAMTDKPRGTRGISAFIVEKGTPGFTFGKREHKLGINTSITMELVFQNCRIPKENLLGKLGQGFRIAMETLDGGRIGVAAQACGLAQAAIDHAVKYAKMREQFGKPIAAQQAIAFMLADMQTETDAARLLIYRAAWLKENGKPYAKEAAMAKLYASDVAMRTTTDAVQIFGGYGYSREYPVERLMRNAKITQIYEGTNQIQKLVISAAMLK